MIDSVQRRWAYVIGLFKENIGLKFIAAAWAGWGVIAFFRDEIALWGDESGFKVVNFALSISASWWVIIAAAFILAWLFESSYRMSQGQQGKITELSKIDREDLCRMLGGVYYQNTFYYKAEITLCKQFKGKFEIEQLRDVFTEIEVRAPKHARCNIRFQWTNGRHVNAQYRFYVLDKNGNPQHIENIYQDLSVFLNDKSAFSLKLVWDEHYIIEEHAELWVTMSSWCK